MPRRSPVTSVTPALSIATSIGTSTHGDVNVGLRERRRIVDPVAGHRDLSSFALQTLDVAHLVLRQDFGEDVLDAKLAGDGLAGASRIAGEHHDALTGSVVIASPLSRCKHVYRPSLILREPLVKLGDLFFLCSNNPLRHGFHLR